MEDDFELFTSCRYDPALLQVPSKNLTWASWNWANESPFYMLDFHRDRLLRAAAHWDWDAAVEVLEGAAGLGRLASFITLSIADTGNQQSPLKVKISITKDGKPSLSCGPVPETTLANLLPEELPPPGETHNNEISEMIPTKSPVYDVLVDDPQTARSEHTHFKTTKRAAYEAARQRAQINPPDRKEVLIVNEATGAVMEGSTTTPYFWRDGRWVTPAVSREYSLEEGSGGQSGTSRRWALERYVDRVGTESTATEFFRWLTKHRGLAVEGTILADSLVDGEECWLSNGVRGFFFGRVKLR